LNPSQPFLRDVSSDAAPASSTCPWERAHPGQSCPICTRANAEDLVPALESEVHPEHEGHEAIAEAARVTNVLEPLVGKLHHVNVFTDSSELQQLTTDDLNALIAYADEPTPMPPQLIARCCRAAEPGSIMQVCQNCAKVLQSANSGVAPYPVNALVGFDCAAYRPADVAPVETAVEEPKTEPTRTITPRGSKKRARKEPEQERAKQVTEGHQRGRAIPKSESTRKGTAKAKPAKRKAHR
jgi:hypothetical protein